MFNQIMMKMIPDPVLRWCMWRGIEKFYGEEYLPLHRENTIRGRDCVREVTLTNGCRFNMTRNARFVPSWMREYNYSGILPDDVVLDIGSNVGIFTVAAAKCAGRVFSVDPIYGDEMMENVKLNCLNNVTFIFGVLGDPSTQYCDISFDMNTAVRAPVYSLAELKRMCGGRIDFLKCDCEGGEHFINLPDLLGIRRIEMEQHSETDPRMLALKKFMYEHWDVVETTGREFDVYHTIHAYPKGSLKK